MTDKLHNHIAGMVCETNAPGKPADVTARALELKEFVFDLRGFANHLAERWPDKAADTIEALAAALAEQTRRAKAAEFPDRKAMSKRIAEQRKDLRRLQVIEACHWRFVDRWKNEKRDMEARVAELTAKLEAAQINWRDDPEAIVEDDEPMIGRDYE